MMKGLIITSRGAEESASLEVSELIGSKSDIKDSCIIFNFRSFEDLCLLCYKSQSADRVLNLIGDFQFNDFFSDVKGFFGNLDLDVWVQKNKKFRVECIRAGQHDFKSVDVEAEVSGLILNKYKDKKVKVDIKDYGFILLVYISGNKCYFGVDFAGFELNKRSYKIFLHPNSLRGTIAYSLLRESGFGKNEVMLDPFSRDGVISIEAAFHASGFPVNYYKKDRFAFVKLGLGIDFEKFFSKIDKKAKNKSAIYAFDHLFKYVDFGKKNAKIAGVDKLINFSRTELEWLDIKFKKESVDRIVTSLPLSKNADLGKIYNEFFYQSEYILKKSGAIAIITKNSDFAKKHAEKHNFVAAKEKDVWSGEQMLKIIVFNKKKTI